MRDTFAYALIHSEPPEVYFAENLEVLSEVLARELIGETPSSRFEHSELDKLRESLLENRWGDALAIWILNTEIPVDVFEFGELWTEDQLRDSSYDLVIQKSPIFRDSNA